MIYMVYNIFIYFLVYLEIHINICILYIERYAHTYAGKYEC